MEHDYYQILGVTPTADHDAIRDAYRRKAMQCHPDRGGTHAEMLLVQEAFEVLSVADRRRAYDAARADTNNTMSQQTAATDARDARQRAEQYPPRWADMEELLNRVARDFTDAEHASVDLGRGIQAPTAGKSVSGWVFILLGAILGGVFVSPMIYGLFEGGMAHTPPNVKNNSQTGLCLLFAVAAPVLGGAWVGAAIHKRIGRSMKESERGRCPNPRCGSSRGWDGSHCRHCGTTANGPPPARPEPTQATRIVRCEKCGQQLRVPSVSAELEVTCKSCNHKFGCKPLP